MARRKKASHEPYWEEAPRQEQPSQVNSIIYCGVCGNNEAVPPLYYNGGDLCGACKRYREDYPVSFSGICPVSPGLRREYMGRRARSSGSRGVRLGYKPNFRSRWFSEW